MKTQSFSTHIEANQREVLFCIKRKLVSWAHQNGIEGIVVSVDGHRHMSVADIVPPTVIQRSIESYRRVHVQYGGRR